MSGNKSSIAWHWPQAGKIREGGGGFMYMYSILILKKSLTRRIALESWSFSHL